MKIQDIFDAIPNSEGIDALKVNTLFVLLQAEKEATGQALSEPMYMVEKSREGNPRNVRNPFWDTYLKLQQVTQNLMAELNITPKSRKTLTDKSGGKMPNLD